MSGAPGFKNRAHTGEADPEVESGSFDWSRYEKDDLAGARGQTGSRAKAASGTQEAAKEEAKEEAKANPSMSNALKAALIATGIAGATVVGTAAVAAKVVVEVVGSTLEHGDKWLKTAADTAAWPLRSTAKIVGKTLGEPIAMAEEGFVAGSEWVGHADYYKVNGWKAPFQVAGNAFLSLKQNPVTRSTAGALGAIWGGAKGLFKGPFEGIAEAFSRDNAPRWETPILRTRKAQEVKAAQPAPPAVTASEPETETPANNNDFNNQAAA
jgi:hypothetical protein